MYSVNKIFTQWKRPSSGMLPSRWKKNTIQPDGSLISLKKERKDTLLDRPQWVPKYEWHYQKAVQIPAGFHLTDKMRTYAIGKGIDETIVDAVFEKFCNYHTSKTNRFTSWTHAWRTWIGNQIDWAKSRQQEDGFDALKRKYQKNRSTPDAGELPQQTP